MFEYLAFVRDPSIPDAAQELAELLERLPASAGWQLVFNSASLRVMCRPPAFIKARVRVTRSTVILGPWFPADNPNALRTDPLLTADEPPFPPSGWGDFVALSATTPDRVHIYREPTALLPCLYAIHGHLGVLASNLASLRALTGRSFPASSGYLRDHLLGRLGTQLRQPLIGVTVIHGGERVTLQLAQPDKPTHAMHWTPHDFVPPEARIEDARTARRELHDTLCRCMYAWTTHARTSLMRLSGGLDSSIVFGCLASISRESIIPYTYFNPDGQGNERRWAQAAAALHGMRTLAVAFTPQAIALADIERLQPTVEPVSTLTYLQRAPLERALAKDHHAEVVFTGQGGDSLWCRDSIEQIPLDARLQIGWGPRLLRTCAQVARHTDRSFWQVLAMSAPARQQQQASRSAALSLLIDPQLLQTDSSDTQPHPWLQHAAMHPTLHRRLGALIASTEYYDASVPAADDSPEIISPLLSRPFVEACLRVPSYLHFHHGIERGLAREAFAKELPTEIQRRCWKDRAPGFFDLVLARQRSFVREFLLDGLLVKSHWLSRTAVENALAENTSGSRVSALEILNHLDTESWLRRLL